MSMIIYNRKLFKPYDDTYYVSTDGDVYSTNVHRLLKPNVDVDGYRRVDIHSRHIKIHRLVYLVWVGPIPMGCQINHKNDDKQDNRVENLYAGTQQHNIADCIENQHRIGNMYYLTVFDKTVNKTITFAPASEFQQYSGHRANNGHISRMFGRHWFKCRYKLIEYRKLDNLNHRKNVTTMGDECNPVGLSLSQVEAHNIGVADEEIV